MKLKVFYLNILRKFLDLDAPAVGLSAPTRRTPVESRNPLGEGKRVKKPMGLC